MSEFNVAQAMPKRIEVAYVRTIEPEAPPRGRRAASHRRRSPAPRAPRAPRPPRPAAAASAAEAAPGRRSRRRRRRQPSVGAPRPSPRRARREPADAAAARRFRRCQRQRPTAGRRRGAPASGVAGAPPFEWPASTRLSYVLTGNYRGEVNGTAQVEWIRVDDRYQVNLDLVIGPEFAPIVTRRMTSEGNIAASGLVPTRYDEDTQVVMRDRRRMSVVFEADAVVLANGQRRERLEGVQDTASQFIQMTYVFSTQPERLRVGGTVAFPLALPRTMDNWVYEVVEAQTLKTPFGALAAVPPQAEAAADAAKRADRRAVDRARAALPAGAHPHRAGRGDVRRPHDLRQARDGRAGRSLASSEPKGKPP